MSLGVFRGLCRTIDCFYTGNVCLNGDITHKGLLDTGGTTQPVKTGLYYLFVALE